MLSKLQIIEFSVCLTFKYLSLFRFGKNCKAHLNISFAFIIPNLSNWQFLNSQIITAKNFAPFIEKGVRIIVLGNEGQFSFFQIAISDGFFKTSEGFSFVLSANKLFIDKCGNLSFQNSV